MLRAASNLSSTHTHLNKHQGGGTTASDGGSLRASSTSSSFAAGDNNLPPTRASSRLFGADAKNNGLTALQLAQHNKTDESITTHHSAQPVSSQSIITAPKRYSESENYSRWSAFCNALARLVGWSDKTLSQQTISREIDSAHTILLNVNTTTPLHEQQKTDILKQIDVILTSPHYKDYFDSPAGLRDRLTLTHMKLLLSEPDAKDKLIADTSTHLQQLLTAHKSDKTVTLSILKDMSHFLEQGGIITDQLALQISTPILDLTTSATIGMYRIHICNLHISSQLAAIHPLKLAQDGLLIEKLQSLKKILPTQQTIAKFHWYKLHEIHGLEDEDIGINWDTIQANSKENISVFIDFIAGKARSAIKLEKFHAQQLSRLAAIGELREQRAALVIQKTYHTKKIALHDTKIDPQISINATQKIENINAQIKTIDANIQALQEKMVCIFDENNGNKVVAYRIDGKIIRNPDHLARAISKSEQGGYKALSGKTEAPMQKSVVYTKSEADFQGKMANEYLASQKAGLYIVTMNDGTKKCYQVTRDLVNPNATPEKVSGKLMLQRRVVELQFNTGQSLAFLNYALAHERPSVVVPHGTENAADEQARKHQAFMALPRLNDRTLKEMFSNYEATTLQGSVQLSAHTHNTKGQGIAPPPATTQALINTLRELNIIDVIVPQHSIASGTFVARDLGQTLRQVRSNDGAIMTDISPFLRVTQAMETLHALGIVHRDIKPENLFLKNKVVRLSDLDSMETPNQSSKPFGTPAYTPGKLINDSKNLTSQIKADKLCMLESMIEMTTGTPPPGLFSYNTNEARDAAVKKWSDAVESFISAHVKAEHHAAVRQFLAGAADPNVSAEKLQDLQNLSEILVFQPQQAATAAA